MKDWWSVLEARHTCRILLDGIQKKHPHIWPTWKQPHSKVHHRHGAKTSTMDPTHTNTGHMYLTAEGQFLTCTSEMMYMSHTNNISDTHKTQQAHTKIYVYLAYFLQFMLNNKKEKRTLPIWYGRSSCWFLGSGLLSVTSRGANGEVTTFCYFWQTFHPNVTV